jgi:dienelactone hydrolase
MSRRRPAPLQRRLGVARTYWAGWHSITFTEPAHSGPAGPLPARQLRTEIWYPLAGPPSRTTRPARGPFPVIMYAPGFMQCGRPYADLLKYWATAGYVVVVVDFPHADCLVGTAATEADLLNEPHDLSYVITAVLRLSRARHGLLAHLLNSRKIAIAGQSDGGDVVAAIAGNTCCADHRVVAVAVESGAEWPPMAGAYFTSRTVPILFSQGSADTINPPGCSVDMYLADRAPARYYLDLLGATHTEPYWGVNPDEKIVARVTLAFFDRYALGRARQASVMRRDGNAPGVAALHENGSGTLTDRYCNT